MNYRTLGGTGLRVSEVGMGTMSLPFVREETERIMDAALDRGINYIDTADLYQFGEIEKLLGEVLKGRREKVILASKGGNHWQKGKKDWFWDPSKAYIKSACKASLKRLGTEYLDVYQLHGGTIEDPIDETIEAFQELQQEGLIRHWGLSSIRPNVIKEYAESGISSVMLQYSLLDRRPEEEILDLLQEKRVGVIVRGSVAKGMLTTKAQEKVPEEGFLGHSHSRVISASERIQRYATGKTSAQVAIQYVLDHPGVTTVTAGVSSQEQMIENAETSSFPPLTKEEKKQLQDAAPPKKYEAHRE